MSAVSLRPESPHKEASREKFDAVLAKIPDVEPEDHDKLLDGSVSTNQRIYRCWTKATRREQGNPRRSLNWVVSRRAWFEVFRDRVQCGDWVVPADEVKQAMLYEGRQFGMPARVLELRAERGTYQFGFNPWVDVERHLPFPVSRQKVRLKYSVFSVAVRVVLVLYLGFLVWRWLW